MREHLSEDGGVEVASSQSLRGKAIQVQPSARMATGISSAGTVKPRKVAKI